MSEKQKTDLYGRFRYSLLKDIRFRAATCSAWEA